MNAVIAIFEVGIISCHYDDIMTSTSQYLKYQIIIIVIIIIIMFISTF